MKRSVRVGLLGVTLVVFLSACEVIAGVFLPDPEANAGDDVTIEIGDSVTLNGGASEDPDGEELSYQWSVVARPSESTLGDGDITDSSSALASIVPDAEGEYEFQLLVSVDRGGVIQDDTDTVLVTVLPEGGLATQRVTNPSPPDGASDVSVETGLSWDAADNAEAYTVFLRSDAGQQTIVAEAITETSVSAAAIAAVIGGALPYGTSFEWRVDSLTEEESVQGDIWTFETETETEPVSLPAQVSYVSPANTEDGLGINPTLTWQAAAGAAQYLLRFGTDNPPQPAGEVEAGVTSIKVSALSDFADGLADTTTYFWAVDSQNDAGTTEGPVWRFTTGSSGPDLDLGLVASFSFDEGEIVEDTGSAEPVSQAGVDIVENGFDPPSQALSFSGGESSVVFQDSGSGILNEFDEGMTVSLWLSTNGTGRVAGRAGSWAIAVTRATYFEVQPQFNGDNIGGSVELRPGESVNESEYYHVVLWFDTANGTYRVYLNNESAINGDFGEALSTDANLDFGQDEGGGNSFSGSIDSVRIYNRPLSAEEIEQLFALLPTSP